MQDPVLFALTVLAILGTPGPTNTLLATSGALVGLRRSLPLILAEICGYLLAIAVLHLLLGGVLAAYPAVKTVLRVAIGSYLLFAAFELWTRRSMLDVPPEGVRFSRVFVTTLLNPKAIVFAFGVLPLTLPNAGFYVAAFVGFVLMAALSWIVVGLAVGRVASSPGSRLVPRLSAVVLTCFAGLIAVG